MARQQKNKTKDGRLRRPSHAQSSQAQPSQAQPSPASTIPVPFWPISGDFGPQSNMYVSYSPAQPAWLRKAPPAKIGHVRVPAQPAQPSPAQLPIPCSRPHWDRMLTDHRVRGSFPTDIRAPTTHVRSKRTAYVWGYAARGDAAKSGRTPGCVDDCCLPEGKILLLCSGNREATSTWEELAGSPAEHR